MKITITTPLYPTEDAEKVLSGMQKIFPNAKFKTLKSKITTQTSKFEVLNEIKHTVEFKRIGNTMRYLIAKNANNNNAFFELNKQTAVIGKIHFIEEKQILGSVKIEYEGKVEELSQYLAPST